jgi:hypothetical protein
MFDATRRSNKEQDELFCLPFGVQVCSLFCSYAVGLQLAFSNSPLTVPFRHFVEWVVRALWSLEPTRCDSTWSSTLDNRRCWTVALGHAWGVVAFGQLGDGAQNQDGLSRSLLVGSTEEQDELGQGSRQGFGHRDIPVMYYKFSQLRHFPIHIVHCHHMLERCLKRSMIIVIASGGRSDVLYRYSSIWRTA